MNKEVVCIAGGTGLVGGRLVESLREDYIIHILTRSPKIDLENIKYFKWEPENGVIDIKALACDHLINLTGAGIADIRWTPSRKEMLISSRVNSNKTIYEALLKNNLKLTSITCASAIGYYGDRKDEILDENSKSGKGFLSECSILWEDSSKLLEGFSQTMNILRIGIVLSTKDGALPKMLMTKSVGMLNYFGNGKQYYSWIHIDDLVKIFIEILAKRLPSGIINAVALTPITNKNMMYQIAEKLGGIPLVMSAPEFAIRLGLGEMADVVLNSNRVIPRFLEQNSFQWQFTDVGEAVKDLIERKI